MEQALEKCLQIAKQAGAPSEQVKTFLENGYVPLPWQWKLHAAARIADTANGPTQIAAGGARGPGKTHGLFAQVTLDDAQRFPDLKCLFLRQTGLAAKESFDDLVSKILSKKVTHTYITNKVSFPNGSRVLVGGFKNEDDIDKYIGIEYDVIVVEEANQLSEQKIRKLRGSLRTSKEGWRPRLYLSFNPGGKGHAYVKKTFVEPYREEIETDTRFIPATYNENPHNNPEYVNYLEGLTGQLAESWRAGNFDLLAGVYFTEFSEAIHVVEPFEIPDDWMHFAMMDYGISAATSIHWGAVSPYNQLFLYRELWKKGMTGSEAAEEYASMTPHYEKISYLAADPALWAKKGERDDNLSIAEVFERRYRELSGEEHRTANLQRGVNDRLNGWRVFREYLKPYKNKDGKITARLQIFRTCPKIIETIPLQIHDAKNPEDLDTNLFDENGETIDHGVDGVRYGLMSRPTPRSTPQEIAHKEFQAMIKKKKKGNTLQGLRFYK